MSALVNQKLLLVDDDDLIRDMYRRLLSRQFEIRTAAGADEALVAVEVEGPFAVIISDFRMPGMNGIELLRRVQTLSPQTSRILLTGLLDVPDLGDVSDVTVLGKPCDYPDLLEVLKNAIAMYEIRIQSQVAL